MRYLIDTQVLLWAGHEPERLSSAARRILSAEENALHFSAATIWEVAIKASLKRGDFAIDADKFHRQLVTNNYIELAVTAAQAIVLRTLDKRHGDPFDRMLLAQAVHEGLMLVTADKILSGYEGPIVRV